MSRMALVALLAATLGAGCTSVSVARLPAPRPGARPIRVTTGTVAEPYQSLGIIQIYRSGVLLFGWVHAPNTDLQVAFEEILLPEAERRGADAVMNVRFHEVHYSPAMRVIFMLPIFWIIPYSNVTITGELVKFLPPPAPAPVAPAPAPGPPPPAAASR